MLVLYVAYPSHRAAYLDKIFDAVRQKCKQFALWHSALPLPRLLPLPSAPTHLVDWLLLLPVEWAAIYLLSFFIAARH